MCYDIQYRYSYRHRLQWMHSGCPVSPSEATKCCTARAAPVRPQMQHFKHRQRRQWGLCHREGMGSKVWENVGFVKAASFWHFYSFAGQGPTWNDRLVGGMNFQFKSFFGTSRDMHVETVFAELPLKSRIASREKSPGKLGEHHVKISCDMAVVLPCLARWPMNVSWWQMHQKGAWSLFAKDILGQFWYILTFWRATFASLQLFWIFKLSLCLVPLNHEFEAGVRHSSQRPLFYIWLCLLFLKN